MGYISHKLKITTKNQRRHIIPVSFLLNTLKGTKITLPAVILYYSTLRCTNQLILTPKRYDEHLRRFNRGVTSPGRNNDSSKKLNKRNRAVIPSFSNTGTRRHSQNIGSPANSHYVQSIIRDLLNFQSFFILVAICAVDVDVIALVFNLGSVVVGYVYEDLHELLVTSQSDNNGADKKRWYD